VIGGGSGGLAASKEAASAHPECKTRKTKKKKKKKKKKSSSEGREGERARRDRREVSADPSFR
jgi:hypothetical protein